MLKKKPELLAPAGNMENLKVAINAGADALYLGAKNFSARAFADNFTDEELKEAVIYAHERGVKVYVTINTLLNEKELENAKKLVKYCYEINADALLIQDLGLYYWIINNYPDFEIHCSTQMHVSNISGIRTAKKLGFKRVVIPRESDLEFIKKACDEDIEIETFVHGAICVSYSGQCLMSAFTKNRSANKGMCAQCCRLKYSLKDNNGKRIITDTDYLLSPKDMCLINDIPLLADAGVSSFKIEGRMKSAAYVGYVTSLYRKAIDSYCDNNIPYIISEEEMNNLKVLFNRNFTDDYLFDKGNLFGQITPNHLGLKIGETTGYRNGKLYFRLDRDLNQFDGIRIGDYGCIVNRLYKDELLVNKGLKGEIVSIECKENIRGTVYKTQDYILEKNVLDFKEKKVPVNITADIYPDQKIRAKISFKDMVMDYESEIIPSKAINKPLSEDNIIRQLSKLNDTVYCLNEIKVNTSDSFVPVSELNAFRRELTEKFNEYRLKSFKRSETVLNTYFRDIDDEDKLSNDIYQDNELHIDNKVYKNSGVINHDDYDYDDILVSDFGGILSDKDKIAASSLNCLNSYTYEFLKRTGFRHVILSLESKDNEVKDLMDAYSERTGKMIHPLRYQSGSRTLMYIHSDPFSRYMNDGNKYTLNDGNNTYRIIKENDVLMIKEDKEDIIQYICL
ncbi:MAG: U32 family peptidase [Erysipelotrichaceae bacterium]|nr:U32 family peptidase [Erysipelotrichaceae bacterium]